MRGDGEEVVPDYYIDARGYCRAGRFWLEKDLPGVVTQRLGPANDDGVELGGFPEERSTSGHWIEFLHLLQDEI